MNQIQYTNGVFSHDVTVAILVSQNNETTAMLVSQTSPLRVELYSQANTFFCSNKFAYRKSSIKPPGGPIFFNHFWGGAY